MTRRRLFLFALPVAVVLLGVATWILWPRPPSAITRENGARIELGMTDAEVEAILGGPARDESTGFLMGEETRIGGMAWPRHTQCWLSDSVIVRVLFQEGQVIARDCEPVHRVNTSFLDDIRRWLRL
jgi:hypothetical protein